jgi:hypothetical protein
MLPGLSPAPMRATDWGANRRSRLRIVMALVLHRGEQGGK